jgi:hypothetical protein
MPVFTPSPEYDDTLEAMPVRPNICFTSWPSSIRSFAVNWWKQCEHLYDCVSKCRYVFAHGNLRHRRLVIHQFTESSITDNDLEYFIRQDLLELTQSPAVQDVSVVTWVYFDARNLLGSMNGTDILDPPQGVYNANGTPLTEKFQGSQHFTWNHSQQHWSSTRFYQANRTVTIRILLALSLCTH